MQGQLLVVYSNVEANVESILQAYKRQIQARTSEPMLVQNSFLFVNMSLIGLNGGSILITVMICCCLFKSSMYV